MLNESADKQGNGDWKKSKRRRSLRTRTTSLRALQALPGDSGPVYHTIAYLLTASEIIGTASEKHMDMLPTVNFTEVLRQRRVKALDAEGLHFDQNG